MVDAHYVIDCYRPVNPHRLYQGHQPQEGGGSSWEDTPLKVARERERKREREKERETDRERETERERQRETERQRQRETERETERERDREREGERERERSLIIVPPKLHLALPDIFLMCKWDFIDKKR